MKTSALSPFDVRKTLKSGDKSYTIYHLGALSGAGVSGVDRLPFSIRVLLENLLRHSGGKFVSREDVLRLAAWSPGNSGGGTIPFMPARVVLQDFTGLPALVDLAAMRSAMERKGGDPSRINPSIPADMVIDHSVQVDHFGTGQAFEFNIQKETERNAERYSMLHWGQKAFSNLRVVPPGAGIVHQVNLEYLGSVVGTRTIHGELYAFPDTLVGTDSHTPMINGLGVLGWGVGGIEAEAVLLGQPYYMPIPEVVGINIKGRLPSESTSTDLVLTITEFLREKGVVGRFVEFFGTGLRTLTLPDRATISNMSPEYGATAAFFPVDDETLRYLSATGRPRELVDLVENYSKHQGLFHSETDEEPSYTSVYELDMGKVEPSLAGPSKPHQRVKLGGMKDSFLETLPRMLEAGVTSDADRFDDCGYWADEGGSSHPVPEKCGCPTDPRPLCRCVEEELDQAKIPICDGSVVIAAITSCTNTSNPSVMIGAGLLARNAVKRGLRTRPWVKTSLAPGSGVVTSYLDDSGLTPFLDALGFHVVGYGCTTCIGNSGPLRAGIAKAIEENQLVTAAVLSGNRNYEARINPYIRANYLASPMLVVAYAIAGSVTVDMTHDPLGRDPNGNPVYLKEIWPSREEILSTVKSFLDPGKFLDAYSHIYEGNEFWNSLKDSDSNLFPWDPASIYIREPPFFDDMPDTPPVPRDIEGARILGIFGDTLTTDHISPAGTIPDDSPAGHYLLENGIQGSDFNSFGSRRGNHEVMMRGTFGNIRIQNAMVEGEGGWTLHMPEGERMTIFDAAMRYKDEDTPLVVVGGKEYGAGSSRDWAAKGTLLLGVKAVLAQSFERIHRSNLVGMGVLPLQFESGENTETLGLTGKETLEITGIGEGLAANGKATVTARMDGADEKPITFTAGVLLNSPVEVEYYRHGGILQKVLRDMLENR
ncbi:MAG TPA: aconitate hydratase AcnA [Proteobacteria bacterium]|nr:aconitate hydratase [bacterium BMS3Abin14]HDL54160.1 aconitate hydratase AcnA [Pseudomonadota bacterium]